MAQNEENSGRARDRDCDRELIDAAREEAREIEAAEGAAVVEREPFPKQVGKYRILSKLGKGGMGVVYLAEQIEPFPQRVALKVIKRGMDSEHGR